MIVDAEQLAVKIGLTNSNAPFVEEARRRGQHFIQQPYELYSEDNHKAWQNLYTSMDSCWHKYANEQFLSGISCLQLDPHVVPSLEQVNQVMQPLTGFRAIAVSGYLPIAVFFDCLRRREFPTTITIRGANDEFSPWPDIFHDITGHLPMSMYPAMADTLMRIGECAHTAAELVADIKDEDEKTRRLTNILKALARFFWFTVECGLMKSKDGLKVYGSAFLSSRGEIVHCIESPQVQRYPFQLEWVINQNFDLATYQSLVFVVDSFDHVFDLVNQLERWMIENRLDNVAPGHPVISVADTVRLQI
jgi:phenylalanine-4-hydroxylase